MNDILNGADANDTDNVAGERVPPGGYPELRLVSAKLFTGKKSSHRCFKAVAEVLVPANGKQAGELVEFFEKLEGNKHDSYNKSARADVLRFLGALFGYDAPDEVNKHINGTTLGQVVDENTQPMTGTVFSAVVSYKNATSIFAKWSFGCVKNADGTVKVVRGKGQQAPVSAPVAAPVQAPVVVAPPAPPPVAAPAAPAAPLLPAGWVVHPNDARFRYELANPANIVLIAS